MKARGSINSHTVTRPPQPHCEQQRQKQNETQDLINSNTVARLSQSQCKRQRQKLNDSTEPNKLEYCRALAASTMQAAMLEINTSAEQISCVCARAATRIKRPRQKPDNNEDSEYTPVGTRARRKNNASGNAKARSQINLNTVVRPRLPPCWRQKSISEAATATGVTSRSYCCSFEAFLQRYGAPGLTGLDNTIGAKGSKKIGVCSQEVRF